MALQASWPLKVGEGIGPLRPGMTHSEVLRALAATGVAFEFSESEHEWMEIAPQAIELTFEEEEPYRLLDIVSSHPELAIEGEKIVGATLDVALLAIGNKQFSRTMWRADSDPYDSLFAGEMTGPSTGEREENPRELLLRGTLWLKESSIGLVMQYGRVHQVVLRLPEFVPKKGLGQLSKKQLEMAIDPKLPELFAYAKTTAPRRGWSLLKLLATFALVVSLVACVVLATQAQSAWSDPQIYPGKVTAIEEGAAPKYDVQYQDSAGVTHTLRWEAADFYMLPREVGEATDVLYLKSDPERVLSRPRVRDIGMLWYAPYGIAAMVIYSVLLLVDSFWKR